MSYTFKTINKLAVPAIIGGIVEPLISLSDLAIIGHVPNNSKEAIAAVGIAGSLLSAMIWGLAQSKSAISSIVAQNLGKGRLKNLNILITQIFLFVLVLSLFILGVTQLFSTEIFKSYHASGLILTYCEDYFLIRSFGFPITLITFLIFGIFRGLQNTSYAMKIAITGGVINILLDLLFVHGIKHFIDPMGVKGAAWASLIAQTIMLIMALFYFKSKTSLQFYWSKRKHPEMNKMIVMTFNLFIRTVALNLAMYFGNSYATSYGDQFIAAHTINMNIWLFCSFFIDGYANAGNAIAGKLKGMNDWLTLQKVVNQLLKYAIIVSVILSILLFCSYNVIGQIFNNDPEVINTFKKVFWIVILAQPLNAIAFTYDGIFKGLGEAAFLRNLLIISTFVFFLPSLMITDSLNLKLYAVWIAFPIWMLARASITGLKFKLLVKNSLKNSSEMRY